MSNKILPKHRGGDPSKADNHTKRIEIPENVTTYKNTHTIEAQCTAITVLQQ